MNARNYSLGDTFTVALQCELKAIASERWHNKRNTITINNVNSEDQDHSQLEDTQEVHVRNPNYKGKNYDPNYQARKTETNKQQQQPTMTNNQYKAPYTRPAANCYKLNFSCLINHRLFDCNYVGRKLRWSLKEFDLT